jgi:hypothetical protein
MKRDPRITTTRRVFATVEDLARLVRQSERSNKLHATLRNEGKCINTTARRPNHGAPHRGGRCKECWDRKLARERGEPLPPWKGV